MNDSGQLPWRSISGYWSGTRGDFRSKVSETWLNIGVEMKQPHGDVSRHG